MQWILVSAEHCKDVISFFWGSVVYMESYVAHIPVYYTGSLMSLVHTATCMYISLEV